MDNEKISIWVSGNISYEEQQLLFVPNNSNEVKFLNDFKISTNEFFDYDHIAILYGQFEGKPTPLNKAKRIVKDFLQISDGCWDEIEKKLKEHKIKKINYLLAVPDFEYSSKITKSDKLIFVGNFQYAQDFSSILEFLPEHLRSKLE
ncbi:hypothetical protein [Pasteurella sp. PK-2025]|uniref:hypothetical protein n=1 Tax=Pasteurella sp. PK-2025 TaxID=3413133 RepID=UPI003C75BE63